jgi:tetratricopeptide (TPR) repeat protein
LVIICILGIVAASIPQYVAYRKSLTRQEQAMSEFNKALETNPRDAMVYVIRGTAYYFQKEYEKSWKDVDEKADIQGTLEEGNGVQQRVRNQGNRRTIEFTRCGIISLSCEEIEF